MRSIILTFFGLLSIAISANAQVTTEGRDFWFGFMDNSNAEFIEIYISAEKATSVTIVAPKSTFNVTVTVDPGVSKKVVLPMNLMPTDEGKHGYGIHVTSDNPISLYALNKRQFSADAAVILPTPALGNEYYVVAHMEPPGDIEDSARESEFLVAASEDNTQIEITPTGDTYNGWLKGVPQIIELDAGETYLVKSDEDLSGSYVRTVSQNNSECKNIAVFGGNVFTNVGGCGPARDHLLEQMFPVSTWGKNFLFVPYETRKGGDYVKIIASENDTKVTISKMSQTLFLQAGEVKIYKTLDGVRTISADKPITVAQFSRSQECDGVPSDPFMIIVSPLEQRIKSVTFNAFVVQNIDRYYLTLITASDAIKDVTLDGVDITDQFKTEGNAAYASLNISQGNHRLTAPEGVIAYVYGYGNVESFGYSAGASLENLNAQLLLADADLNIIADEGCLNSDIDFKIQFETIPGEDPLYTVFDWHFDDGAMATGKEVNHTYTEPGDYVIRVIASNGEGSCGNSEVFTKQVSILDVDASEIVGPQSVCPDVQFIDYSIVGAEGNTYEWIVSTGDGQITSGQGTDKVQVSWGASNDNAFLQVIPRNALGCVGATITLPVKINKELTPPLPIGPSDVCYTDYQEVTYSTPQTNGAVYTWEVTGGTFLNGNTGNTVKVKWNGVGAGKRIRFLESNPLVVDCDGYSEYLEVVVYSEIKPVANITNISCFGLTDGAIELTVTGGKPDGYSATWDNGMTGLSIVGLAAGDYEATITDAAGCQVIETYTIIEPAQLDITNAEVLPVRCFQESNGSISLDITGGTPNAQGEYSIQVVGVNFDQTYNTPMITDLPAGGYAVTVTDANGCGISRTYTVSEPPALAPFLDSFINQPICPQATNGTTYIEAIGGTPDYQFYWSNKPTQDSQEGSDFSQGAYSLTIRDANGCETVMDFDVEERFPKIFIPNAFSPNNDDFNDEFKPVTDCNLQYSMQIFNKWGEIIFSTEDITKGWDGRYKGKKVLDGQYSYIIFYAGALNGVSFEETRRGSLKLFR
ncbi:gliding motility-associated C-terminal domain-containing protein [Roseivirga sp.]|uniref:T9SS type B sorting domain-containing protein n=1 Tax=Roseivirga sp. TaxID=1964215 RepID=UPI002B264DE7|nr:gliding motility-associated C-terminal domain-containing protein [Roseivirga sp.]